MTPAECHRCNGFRVVDVGDDELACDCVERDPQQLARLALAVRAGVIPDRGVRTSVSRRAPDGALAEDAPHVGFMAIVLTPKSGIHPSWVFPFGQTFGGAALGWCYSLVRSSGAVGIQTYPLRDQQRILLRLPSTLDQRPLPDGWVFEFVARTTFPGVAEDGDFAWRVYDAIVLMDKNRLPTTVALDSPTPKAAKPQLGLFDGTGK